METPPPKQQRRAPPPVEALEEEEDEPEGEEEEDEDQEPDEAVKEEDDENRTPGPVAHVRGAVKRESSPGLPGAKAGLVKKQRAGDELVAASEGGLDAAIALTQKLMCDVCKKSSEDHKARWLPTAIGNHSI